MVDVGREWMEVAFESWLVRPADKFNPGLIGRIALRHPFGFRYSERVEESLELRRRTFADADDSDRRRFDERYFCSVVAPPAVQQVRSHPPGRASAEDEDGPRRGRHLTGRRGEHDLSGSGLVGNGHADWPETVDIHLDLLP